MINRTLVRTRVIQNLFAYYNSPDSTPLKARKELLKSFSSTYNLYLILLDLSNEFVRCAEEQISEGIQRAKVTHRPFKSNRKFVDNKFSNQLFNNRQLRNALAEQHLGWDAALSSVDALFKQFTATYYYEVFMTREGNAYTEEKRLWRRMYENLLPENEELLSALEEMEIRLDETNWTTDLNVVLSYIIKTIKQFKEDSTPDQPLLPMFDNEDELKFAEDLLLRSIDKKEETDALIAAHLKGWDADRIAFMDRIILQAALTELLCFDEIAVEVTLNEYLELAKEYSGDKSYIFINGILDEILRELKNENKLFKAITLKETKNQ